MPLVDPGQLVRYGDVDDSLTDVGGRTDDKTHLPKKSKIVIHVSITGSRGGVPCGKGRRASALVGEVGCGRRPGPPAEAARLDDVEPLPDVQLRPMRPPPRRPAAAPPAFMFRMVGTGKRRILKISNKK